MVYYAEHGAYYTVPGNVDYDPVLMVDARGNKYFKTFRSNSSSYAGAWAASADDSANAGDWIDLYWSADLSAPATIDGHQLPAFRMYINGESIWSNS